MKICRLFYFVALVLTLTAFVVGDYAELENLLNARAGFDFTKSAKNIKFQVPKGTVGKVLSLKKFNSGNYGVELDLQNGKNKGEKVFVYFTPGKPNITFTKENPLKKKTSDKKPKKDSVNPEEAQFAQTKTEVRAYRAPSADPKPTTIPAATSKGVDGAVVQQVQQGIEKLRQVTAPAKCTDCEVAMAGREGVMVGKEIDQKCEETKSTIGHIEIWRSMVQGKCEIEIWPKEEQQKKWARRYIVKSNGQFETKDNGAARSFYFFPRKNEISYRVSEDQKTITLQTTSDVQIQVSTETGKIKEIKPAAQWKEYDPTSAENEPIATGFLTISPSPGTLMLDLQMGNGDHPEIVKSVPAILKTAEGKTCRIPKASLFQYAMEDGVLTSFDFKFKSDQEFESFYKKQCKW